MLSRPHPRYGWLHLQPADWRESLQKQCEARDRLNDPHHSGPPPEWCRWVDEVQMPRLATRPQYQQQFSDRVAELLLKLAGLQHQIAGGRLDLEPAAGICRREIDWITALVEVPTHG
jgi:hypothetical protein